ncbi:ferritin-like domain-containing protein [Streptomyces olivochromogenes]|uniref:ferritin-like domain-containing protein n=1 Tax=Streptomyces olivochromogenes TaxID=1963 RepID=UPI001F16A66E|nr:ferritin-like protein [Streptomyces olivochromogenes]
MTTVELGYTNDGIVQLMRTPSEQRSLGWLQSALQQAITLEIATLPPYLCGYWSILGGSEASAAARKAILTIIYDEMSHLGHVCNMLTTIGGQPLLADEKVIAPYPCPLPGGVRPKLNPKLEVYLSGFTRESVKMFSEIEAPEKPLASFGADEEEFRSIGLFYSAILEVFEQHLDWINGRRQVIVDMKGQGEGNSLFAIESIEDVRLAITIIKEQGEGTDKTPENKFPGYKGELAHYYVFREIYRGKKLAKVSDDPPKWDFAGADIPMPSAYPMGTVPKGGWAKNPDTVPDEPVRKVLDAFNMTFSNLLRALDDAWNQDDPNEADKHLFSAYAHMRSLEGDALDLMQMPLPKDRKRSYGPEFRYVPRKP